MQCQRHLFFLILSLIVFQNNIKLNSADEYENLYEAISLIVEGAFLRKTRPLVFYTNFDKNSTKKLFGANDLINGILHKISNATYKVIFNRNKLFFNLKHYEVILLESITNFKDFYIKMRYIGNMDLARSVLFISSLTTLDYDAIYFIFKDLYYMQMLKVSLVVMLENTEIVMLSYFPFTQNTCRDFRPVIINKYLADQKRWENIDYFPLKLNNFYGCPLSCCTWKEMPYFDVKPDKKNPGKLKYVGLDASILNYAATALNFTPVIHWIDPMTKDNIFHQDCDLAVGGFTYQKGLDDTADFSQTKYILFSHIYFVSNVMNFHTTYQKLAFPFNYTVWLALGLTFALSSLVIYICGRQRQWSAYRNFLIGSANNSPHFHIFAIAVGANMTPAHLPKRNFARFLLTCWLLLMFILRVAYQSGMYQMLRDNKQWNPPQTIENVYEQGFLISTTTKNQKYLNILPETKRVHIYNTTILEAFNNMLNAKEPIALIVPYEYFGYFGIKNVEQWRNLHLVRERLLTQQLTIYVRHNSYLIQVLSAVISCAEYFGFPTVWNRKYVMPINTALRHTGEVSRGNSSNSDYYPLSMKDLGAIFTILIWLHVLATVIFLIEIIWHRYANPVKKWIVSNGTIKINNF